MMKVGCHNCLFSGGFCCNSCFCSIKCRNVTITDVCDDSVPRKLNLDRKGRGRPKLVDIWLVKAPQKISWFAANYGKVRNSVIAEELGIHEVRVPVVARQLGLQPDQRRTGWKWYGKGEKLQKYPKLIKSDNLSRALSLAGITAEQITKCICALMQLNNDL